MVVRCEVAVAVISQIEQAHDLASWLQHVIEKRTPCAQPGEAGSIEAQATRTSCSPVTG